MAGMVLMAAGGVLLTGGLCMLIAELILEPGRKRRISEEMERKY